MRNGALGLLGEDLVRDAADDGSSREHPFAARDEDTAGLDAVVELRAWTSAIASRMSWSSALRLAALRIVEPRDRFGRAVEDQLAGRPFLRSSSR